MTRDDDTRLAEIACRSPIHGTRRAYTDHGCRCPETVELMRRNWRRKRPTGHRLGVGSRPPGTDVDPVAVERAVAGDLTVRLTGGELSLAVAELTRRGQSARAIAVRLGVSDRTVTRHRAQVAVDNRVIPVERAVRNGFDDIDAEGCGAA